MKAIAAAFSATALLAFSAAAQPTTDQYLDYYIVKVKPEKRAEFDAVAKKIADANRRNHGDTWLAYETVYGDNDTVYFGSSRRDMAAIDSGNETFMKALKESFGAGAESVLHEMEACATSARGELRRRRWDLSSNAPQNPEDMAKSVGNARYIRTTMFRVRPGHVPEFEEMMLMIKALNEKTNPSRTSTITQAVAGQTGAVFYISSLVPSLASYDAPRRSLKDALGEEAYARYQKLSTESILMTESMIGKFLPELSNPPETIVNVTRDFWMPKTAMTGTAARAKQKK